MMKSKKGLSGVLAVLMMVSMLSCFTLPAAAANENYYYVTSSKEWDTVAAAINNDSDYGEGKTIIIQSDIDFGSKAPTQIDIFAGTLDGKGYKFTNIVMNSDDNAGACLFEELTGTIKNLTLDSSCTFNNSVSSLFSAVNLGAFAATINGGTITKCASYATYTADGRNVRVGGFFGTSTGSVTIDGCIFEGVVTSSGSGGKAGAFVATPNTNLTIKYSIARGTLTAASTGTDTSYFNKSYTVDSAVEPTSQSGINGAVWTVNNQREQNINDGIYLSVDANGSPCFGDINNRVVRVTSTGLADKYYAPRMKEGDTIEYQTRFTPDSISGKVWEVSGAERRGDDVYIGSSDITLNYVDATEYNLQKARTQLEAMVAAYEQMDRDYFTSWTKKQTWLDAAKSVLGVGNANLGTLQAQIDAESNYDDDVVPMTDPADYPSVKDYNTYKYIDEIKDYKVEDAAAWRKAVELSNHVENPNATNFSGITLHLTGDINMGSMPMKPLCYGGIFDGNLDGHDKVFQNIKIEIDSSYGTVGLIGVLGETAARYVQNVGIESGSIKVTGWPRHKKAVRRVNYSHNCVGGIVGECYYNTSNAGSMIRKCWNNADIYVKNSKYVGGILGSGRQLAVVDSCFNLGYTEGYGLLGYGHEAAIICNSMSGAVQSSMALFRATLFSDTTDVNTPERQLINVSGVRNTLSFDNFTVEARDQEQAFVKEYNAENTEFSNAAAAWRVNANYVQQSYGTGERIYYTLNKDGDVRFGDKTNQIYRIKMVCDQDGATCTEHPVRYAYGIAGQEIPLGFDIGANYFACDIKDVEGVTINKENVLNFSKDVIIKVDETLQGKEKAEAVMTIPVYVDYNADRGNVNGKGTVDVLDALDAVRMLVGYADPVLKTADVNSNHKVDINDAYRIICCALNLNGNGNFNSGLPETKDQYVKVLSYNIKGCYYDPYYDSEDGNGTPFSRFGPVMDELKKIDADIMGFQEIVEGHPIYSAGRNVLEEICNSLNNWKTGTNTTYQYHYAPSRYYSVSYTPIPTAGSGIISKYPIIKSEIVLFEGNGWPDDPERNLDTSSVPRAFTWYQIDVNDEEGYQQGEDIIFYNTHLSTGYSTNGISGAQLQFMLEYMQEHHASDRIVCTGDLNLGAYLVKNVIDKVNNSSGGNTSVSQKFIALNGDKKQNAYTKSNHNSGSMVDNIIVSENVEYFKFGESKYSASPALNTSAALYGSDYSYGSMSSYREAYEEYYDYEKENTSNKHFLPVRDPNELTYDDSGTPTNGVSNEVYADNPQWTPSDHMPLWAYIKK